MDDFEKVFALIDLVSDPKTAKKNADDMKAARALNKENKDLLKKANADHAAAAAERKAVMEEKAKLENGWAALKAAENDLKAERASVAIMRKEAGEELNARKDAMKQAEAEAARRLKQKQEELASVEAEVTAAKQRRDEVRGEIEAFRARLRA